MKGLIIEAMLRLNAYTGVNTMNHRKKILPEYFNDILHNNKRFEIRNNDAGYVVGDTITLMELDGTLTGKEIEVEITYTSTYGQQKGMIVLGFNKIEKWGDKEDDLTEAINDAHCCETGEYAVWDEAMRLVSNRYSKASLVDLVGYLLLQNKKLKE